MAGYIHQRYNKSYLLPDTKHRKLIDSDLGDQLMYLLMYLTNIYTFAPLFPDSQPTLD